MYGCAGRGRLLGEGESRRGTVRHRNIPNSNARSKELLDPLQTSGNKVPVVASHENGGPQVRIRDQGGSPILANVGHLHDREHRLSTSRLRDKLGYVGQGFGGEFGNGAEFVPSNNDTSDSALKGGMKCLQLFAVSATRGIGISDRLTLSRSIRPSRELYSHPDKRNLPQHALIPTYSISMMFRARETRSSLV